MGTEALIATLVLGAMCGAMWYLARVARRRMGIGAGTVSSDGLRVVGKRPLDQKNSLYVIEIAGGRHILVGASVEGGISKVDDISRDEFEAMTADDEDVARRPRLRIAGGGPAAGAQPEGADPSDGSESAPEQRFASVGESFQMLLGKARDARTSRRDRASGDD
jgi:flagellar biogenesis protein FliO